MTVIMHTKLAVTSKFDLAPTAKRSATTFDVIAHHD